jgi:glycosyltransferase involved in cell wall biosynthesis
VHVALDYLPATTHAPGVGRYARELVRALVALADGPELTLFEVGPGARRIGEPHLGLAGAANSPRRRNLRVPRRLLSAAGRFGSSVDRLCGAPDLFQRCHPGWPPLRRTPVVRAVAELPPPGSPAEQRWRESAAQECAWITFSAAGTAALVERMGCAAEQVFETPVGCDHWARQLSAPVPLADPPQVLVLGALRRERLPELVLDTCDELRRRGQIVQLLFCGGRGDAAALLERRVSFSAGRSLVRWIEPVEADLPRLVAESAVLVHLSSAELTAVTPLEALAVGTPVVVSDLPAFRQALGAQAWYVTTPPSLRHRKQLPEQLAEALASAHDPLARERRRAQARAFPWAECARITAAAWRSILAQR